MNARIAIAAGALLGAALGRDASADSQLWMEGGVTHKLAKRVSIGFDQHLRFDEDLSRVAAVMPEAKVEYRAIKNWLVFGGGYRLAYERDGDDDMAVRHRLHVDAKTRVQNRLVRVSYRVRLQEKFREEQMISISQRTLRNCLSVKLRPKAQWRPEASAELWQRLTPEGLLATKIRFTFGTDIELGRRDIDVYYRVEIPQDDPDDPITHIIGLGVHAPI